MYYPICLCFNTCGFHQRTVVLFKVKLPPRQGRDLSETVVLNDLSSIYRKLGQEENSCKEKLNWKEDDCKLTKVVEFDYKCGEI